MDESNLDTRLRAMVSHRGGGIPTQYVNPDGPEAADRIEALEMALLEIAQLRPGSEQFADLREFHAAEAGAAYRHSKIARDALAGGDHG